MLALRSLASGGSRVSVQGLEGKPWCQNGGPSVGLHPEASRVGVGRKWAAGAHRHPSALWSTRHLCCLGSQAVEITSEGEAVLVVSQKIGKCENSCPPRHIGCGCQSVLCARNTSLSRGLLCFTCGHCCCPAPGIQGPWLRLLLRCPCSHQRHLGPRPHVGLGPESASKKVRLRGGTLENSRKYPAPVLQVKWPWLVPLGELREQVPQSSFLGLDTLHENSWGEGQEPRRHVKNRKWPRMLGGGGWSSVVGRLLVESVQCKQWRRSPLQMLCSRLEADCSPRRQSLWPGKQTGQCGTETCPSTPETRLLSLPGSHGPQLDFSADPAGLPAQPSAPSRGRRLGGILLHDQDPSPEEAEPVPPPQYPSGPVSSLAEPDERRLPCSPVRRCSLSP